MKRIKKEKHNNLPKKQKMVFISRGPVSKSVIGVLVIFRYRTPTKRIRAVIWQLSQLTLPESLGEF